MPKIIINLLPFSNNFKTAVLQYCKETGNPDTPERHTEIFYQCLSQIIHKMDMDGNAFMANLMELPYWETIHYLATPVDYELTESFRASMRAFGLAVWHELISHYRPDEPSIYVLESCDISMAVIGVYVDAGTVDTYPGRR